MKVIANSGKTFSSQCRLLNVKISKMKIKEILWGYQYACNNLSWDTKGNVCIQSQNYTDGTSSILRHIAKFRVFFELCTLWILYLKKKNKIKTEQKAPTKQNKTD